MRFVAALMVIVFHTSSGAPFFAAVPWPLHSIIDCGYVWVGFFFVLSGFILSYQYLDRVQAGHFSTREFLLARFARIYPAHLLGFVIVAGLLPIKKWPWGAGGGYPPGGTIASFADAGATLALVHSWVPSFALTFNFPAWSISTEFFFYLCFPLLVLAAVRWRLRRVIAFGVAVYVSAVAGNLLYCAMDPYGWLGNDWAHDEGRNFIKFFPLVRLPEFCIGVVIGRVFAERTRLRLTETIGEKLIIAGGIAVLFGLSMGERVPFVLMHNVALTIPFALLVLGFALAPAYRRARWLSHRFLVALGEASYSAYILQAIVLWIFLYPDGLYESADMRIALSSRAAVIAAIIGLSLLSHQRVEQPLRRWIRQFGTEAKRTEPVMAVSVAES